MLFKELTAVGTNIALKGGGGAACKYVSAGVIFVLATVFHTGKHLGGFLTPFSMKPSGRFFMRKGEVERAFIPAETCFAGRPLENEDSDLYMFP